jgi:GSH-dependent disulfide-bond oxidoreductase
MIDLHYWPTPNGWKVTIALAAMGLEQDRDWRLVPVDIGRGGQFAPDFLAISPNNRMPAIVDHAPADGGAPISVFESGAILVYLAEKTGRFLPPPSAPRERKSVLEWLMWQMGGLGPMMGQNGHFLLYAPDPIPYAIERYGAEARRLFSVLDGQLGRTGAYVAGDALSIADFAIVPWVRIHKAQQLALDDYPRLRRWYDAMVALPAVRQGMDVGKALRRTGLDEEARKALFGQSTRAGS